jgi:hypothetical protein
LEPDGYPRDEVLKYVLSAFNGGALPMTLRDLYRNNPKYSWGYLIGAVNHLVSEGFLEGKGDGFVVHYSLTSKGRNAALTTNGGKTVEGSP